MAIELTSQGLTLSGLYNWTTEAKKSPSRCGLYTFWNIGRRADNRETTKSLYTFVRSEVSSEAASGAYSGALFGVTTISTQARCPRQWGHRVMLDISQQWTLTQIAPLKKKFCIVPSYEDRFNRQIQVTIEWSSHRVSSTRVRMRLEKNLPTSASLPPATP